MGCGNTKPKKFGDSPDRKQKVGEIKRRSQYGSCWLSQLGAVAQVGTLGPRVGCRFLSVSVFLGYEGGIR